MNTTSNQKTLEQLLNEPIPRSAVKQRQGGGGRSLSYLEGHYVIDRLNQVFGPMKWASKSTLTCVFNAAITGPDRFGKEQTMHHVSYIAQVTLAVEAADAQGNVHRTEHTATGYGDGSDKLNPGKAHELAVKEAETDALKRAAKNLGQSMGLALYDKDQTNVEDDAPSPKTSAGPGPQTHSSSQKAQVVTPASVPVDAVSATTKPASTASVSKPSKDREKTLNLIQSLVKVAIAKGVMSKDEYKTELRARFGVEMTDDLPDTQATDLLKDLQTRLMPATV